MVKYYIKSIYTAFKVYILNPIVAFFVQTKWVQAQVERKHETKISIIKDRLKGGQKVKVGFLVTDRTKWNCQKVVECLLNENFAETTLVFIAKSQYKNLKGLSDRSEYELDLNFYKRTGLPLKERTHEELDNLEFDILFIQHPWGLQDLPKRLLGRTLCVYMHYGYLVTYNPNLHVGLPQFHPYLWRILVQHRAHEKLLENVSYLRDRQWKVGYPKLDELKNVSSPGQVGSHKAHVLYAPHHSIGRLNPVRLSTFDWTAHPILELKESNPNIYWTYKPHSQLRFTALHSGLFTEVQYADYLEKWRNGENSTIYDSGDYFELFKASDLLLTDCGSFLAEYLPTGRPIIRLVSKNNPVPFNEIGQRIAEVCYNVNSIDELRETFTRVVIEGVDDLKEGAPKAQRGIISFGDG
jgi:hypothetical protein